MTLINSTLSGNRAGSGGFGGGIRNAGTANLKHTIVANNTATGAPGPDLSGAFNSHDYNFIENATGATFTGTTTHNITGLDPKLGPLANNGSPTQTHALLAGVRHSMPATICLSQIRPLAGLPSRTSAG